MTSQISGPCCDSDIELDPYKKSLVSDSHVHPRVFANKFKSCLKIFIVKGKESSLLSATYILNIINVCQDKGKHGKNLYRWVILFITVVYVTAV